MRILHLLYESKGDPFGTGGVGTRAYEIYGRLRERHDITFLCKKYQGADDREIEGILHIFAGTENSSLSKTLLSYAYHASKFVKLHGHEYDIIVEDFSPAIPTFYQFFLNRPVVLQIQGYTGRLYFRKYNPFSAAVLFVIEMLKPRFYDNFIFVNSETVKKYPGVGAKRRAIISNGISTELLTLPDGDGEYILFLGRIDVYGKGLDILLDAYRDFHKSFPGIRLVIAGEGRDMEGFKSAMMKLPDETRKNIELPGWVSDDAKLKAFSKALFAIFPSRHEVQSIAALEAMGSGKAVIASSIPEFRFVKDIGAGLEFKAGDALSLARTMEDMMITNVRKEMGNRGREWVRNFTWDTMAIQYEEFLCRVAKKRD